jgi:hypothetical protein
MAEAGFMAAGFAAVEVGARVFLVATGASLEFAFASSSGGKD